MKGLAMIRKFETLENRELLAWNVLGDVLHYDGTDGVDTSLLIGTGSAVAVLQVVDNGVQQFNLQFFPGVKSVEADLKGGNDSLYLSGLARPISVRVTVRPYFSSNRAIKPTSVSRVKRDITPPVIEQP